MLRAIALIIGVLATNNCLSKEIYYHFGMISKHWSDIQYHKERGHNFHGLEVDGWSIATWENSYYTRTYQVGKTFKSCSHPGYDISLCYNLFVGKTTGYDGKTSVFNGYIAPFGSIERGKLGLHIYYYGNITALSLKWKIR